MSNSSTGGLEALARLPEPTHPTVSSDGSRVAFYYAGTGRNELHVLDVETGEFEQWSDGEVPESDVWPVRWTADGGRVLFHHDGDGSEQHDVYAIGPDGSTEPVLETDGMTTIRDVGADGDTLLVGSNHAGEMDVYHCDLSTGETARLTDYGHPIWTSHLSPDADRVAYAANETDHPENSDVYVAEVAEVADAIDENGSDPRRLDVGTIGTGASPADWGPDGDRLLLSDDSRDLDRCGVYDLATDEVRWYGDLSFVESPAFFTPDGDRFLALRKRDAVTTPVVYDVETGEGRELDLPEGVATFGMRSERVVDRDRILVSHTSPTRLETFLVYDLATDEYETLFEPDYGAFSPDDFVAPEYVTFESDGVPDASAAAVDHDPYESMEIGALLYDSGERPSPLVVKPHGGPRQSDRRAFDYRVQFLVDRGFTVLEVNFRGSTGRGREFARQLNGDWGGAEQGDIASGVEFVLDRHDWLDGDRVAVYGGSFGGFSTYWQLVQYPDLYAAGVAVVGFTDLADFHENTLPQLRTGFVEKHLGTPAENPDLYRERSPVEHAANLSAPLLMVHGENDPRVPVSQARVFRDALRAAGFEEGADGDFEYHELDGGHFAAGVEGKVRTLELLDEFLARRLDG